MGSSSDPEKSMESNSEPGDAKSLGATFREQLEARRDREKHLFQQDSCGRTPLFYVAENGIEEQVQSQKLTRSAGIISTVTLQLLE